MIGGIKDDWEKFKQGEPGERFEERYRRRRQNHRGWWDPIRVIYVVLGVVLVVGSALFGWAPGPGMLTFLIGLGMIAGEFRIAARLLDRGEVQANKFWQFVTKVWCSSGVGKAAILVTLFIPVSGLAYGAYYLFFSG